MRSHAAPPQDGRSLAISEKQEKKSIFQFVDNRPKAIAQRKLQGVSNGSLQVKTLAQLQTITNNHALIPLVLIDNDITAWIEDNIKNVSNQLDPVALAIRAYN